MNTRKLLSTLATAGLILSGSTLISACSEDFVGESPQMTLEDADLQAGKQIERYFLPPPPPPPGDAPDGSRTSSSDSTSTS